MDRTQLGAHASRHSLWHRGRPSVVALLLTFLVLALCLPAISLADANAPAAPVAERKPADPQPTAQPPSSVDQLNQQLRAKGYGWTAQAFTGPYQAGGVIDDPAAPSRTVSSALLAALPDALDWRDHAGNYVSAPRDQSYCGASWAFASVAALESLQAIATQGMPPDLAEQQLISCDLTSWGCWGGSISNAARYLKNHGLPPEDCFAYQGSGVSVPCDDGCADWEASAVKVGEWEPVGQTIEELKVALQDGPLPVGLEVYADFISYGGGVYEYLTGRRVGGDAVLLIGYEDTPGQYGGGYLIGKNSRGTGWGEGGYFRIGYSQVGNWVQFGKNAHRFYLQAQSGDTPLVDTYEDDDDWDRASVAIMSQSQTHSIYPGGDADWVSFAIEQTSDVVIETSGVPGGDTEIILFNAGLDDVAYNDDRDQDLYSRIAGRLGPGTYYVHISALDEEVVISNYAVQVSIVEPMPYGDPVLWVNDFGVNAGGWTSQDAYPRLLGDVNGDGRADVVAFGHDNVYVSLSTGASLADKTVWLTNSFCAVSGWSSMDAFPRFLADINGDYRKDLVGFGNSAVYVSLSNGSGFEPQAVWLRESLCAVKGWVSQDTYPRLFGDLNGDGREDVLGFGYKAVYVSLSNGDSLAPQQVWLQDSLCAYKGWSSQQIYPRYLADVDGDGKVDILGFGAQAICVARSAGGGFLPQEIWRWDDLVASSGWTNNGGTPRLMGDVDGDGRADILGLGSDALLGSLSTGTAFADPTTWGVRVFGAMSGWSSQAVYPRDAVDITGDGRVDLVGFGTLGVYVSPGEWVSPVDGGTFQPLM